MSKTSQLDQLIADLKQEIEERQRMLDRLQARKRPETNKQLRRPRVLPGTEKSA